MDVLAMGLVAKAQADLLKVTMNTTGGKIVALGASNTEQGGKVNWVKWLSYLLGREVVNLGVGGDKVSDGLARIDSVLAENPSICLIDLYGNDAFNSIPIATSKANYEAIIDTLQANGITPVIISCSPVEDALGTYTQAFITFNRYLQNLCYDNGFILIDAYTPFIDADGSQNAAYFSDVVHFNEAGCLVLAKEIADKLDYLASDLPGYWPGEIQAFPTPLFDVDTNADGLADGLADQTTAGVTVAFERTAHPEYGYYQQVSKSASGNALDGAGFYANLDMTKLTLGGNVEVSYDLEVDSINGDQVTIGVAWFDAAWNGIGATSYVPEYNIKVITTKVHIVEAVAIPATAVHGLLTFIIYGTGASVARIGRLNVKMKA